MYTKQNIKKLKRIVGLDLFFRKPKTTFCKQRIILNPSTCFTCIQNGNLSVLCQRILPLCQTSFMMRLTWGCMLQTSIPLSDLLNQSLRGQALDASGGSYHQRNLGRFPIETEMFRATFSIFIERLLDAPCPGPASFVLRGLC